MKNPFRRPRTEQRDLLSSTLPTWSDVSAGHVTLGAGGTTRALSLIPVFAANRLLSGTVSTLPLKTYRDVGDEKLQAPQAQLFRQLEDEGRLVPWLQQCMTSLGLRGNAFGRVLARDGFEFPTQIEWLNPTAVLLENTPQGYVWRVGSDVVSRRDMLHIPWFTLPGEVLGLSPIGTFAATINTGLAADRYGQTWFDNGGFPPGTFKNSAQTVTQEQTERIKARLSAAIRTRQPLVYGADWEYTPLSVPPNEAQFIETLRMNATQIASIYNIPPEMIGGETGKSMTYQNVEQQQINFVMMTLRPWLVLLERAFSALLPNRQYVRFNADALIRADIKTRYEVYEIGRTIGLRSIDELRRLEELPSLPGGAGADYAPLGTTRQPASPTTGPPALRSIDGWQQPA